MPPKKKKKEEEKKDEVPVVPKEEKKEEKSIPEPLPVANSILVDANRTDESYFEKYIDQFNSKIETSVVTPRILFQTASYRIDSDLSPHDVAVNIEEGKAYVIGSNGYIAMGYIGEVVTASEIHEHKLNVFDVNFAHSWGTAGRPKLVNKFEVSKFVGQEILQSTDFPDVYKTLTNIDIHSKGRIRAQLAVAQNLFPNVPIARRIQRGQETLLFGVPETLDDIRRSMQLELDLYTDNTTLDAFCNAYFGYQVVFAGMRDRYDEKESSSEMRLYRNILTTPRLNANGTFNPFLLYSRFGTDRADESHGKEICDYSWSNGQWSFLAPVMGDRLKRGFVEARSVQGFLAKMPDPSPQAAVLAANAIVQLFTAGAKTRVEFVLGSLNDPWELIPLVCVFKFLPYWFIVFEAKHIIDAIGRIVNVSNGYNKAMRIANIGPGNAEAQFLLAIDDLRDLTRWEDGFCNPDVHQRNPITMLRRYPNLARLNRSDGLSRTDISDIAEDTIELFTRRDGPLNRLWALISRTPLPPIHSPALEYSIAKIEQVKAYVYHTRHVFPPANEAAECRLIRISPYSFFSLACLGIGEATEIMANQPVNKEKIERLPPIKYSDYVNGLMPFTCYEIVTWVCLEIFNTIEPARSIEKKKYIFLVLWVVNKILVCNAAEVTELALIVLSQESYRGHPARGVLPAVGYLTQYICRHFGLVKYCRSRSFQYQHYVPLRPFRSLHTSVYRNPNPIYVTPIEMMTLNIKDLDTLLAYKNGEDQGEVLYGVTARPIEFTNIDVTWNVKKLPSGEGTLGQGTTLAIRNNPVQVAGVFEFAPIVLDCYYSSSFLDVPKTKVLIGAPSFPMVRAFPVINSASYEIGFATAGSLFANSPFARLKLMLIKFIDYKILPLVNAEDLLRSNT